MKSTLKYAVTMASLAMCANAVNAGELNPVSAGDYGGSHANYPASKAIDGNTAWASRWAANSVPANLYVDLGSTQTVTHVGVAWGQGDSRSHNFEIRARAGTSGDWALVYSNADSSGNTTDVEIYDIDDIQAQQIRVKVFDNSTTSDWTNITEMKVYNGVGSSNGAFSVPGKIEAEEFVDYYDVDSANKGGDYRTGESVDIQTTGDSGGGYNIGWTAAGEWLEYDINVTSAGNYEADVRIASPNSGKSFSIDIDGSNVTGNQSINNTGNWQTYYTKTVSLGNLSAGNHTLRFNMETNGFNLNWIDIKSAGNTGPGNLNPALPPSGNFDLSQWKITLPTSKNAYFGSGGTAAAEIQPDDCSNSAWNGVGLDEGYEDQDYFYTESDGSMTFETPLTGGASTITSSYVRSELRELYNWSPCDDDGAANWSPTGTHVLRGTVKVSDYYSADPQTIVGQIHAKDSSKALLKLQWDGPDKDVRAIINEDPTNGNPFSIDFGLVPGTDQWSYVITMDDSTMTIDVTYDGTTVSDSVTFGSGSMSSDWNNHVYYFKAGNYAQADKDSGGNFKVQFYNLEVSHSN